MTLTRRLILGFGLLALLLLTLPSLLIGVALQRYFYAQATRETLDIVTYLQQRIDAVPAPPDAALLSQRLEGWMAGYLLPGEGPQLESAFFVQLRLLQGGQTISTANLDDTPMPVIGPGQPEAGELQPPGLGRIPVLLHQSRISYQGRPWADVRVAVSLAEYNAILRQLLIFWLAGSLLALLLTAVLGTVIGRQILAPLAHLTQAIEGMMQSEKLGRIETENLPPDQIRRLADTFNVLLEQLGEMLERQQRFVSDASHELRSPLTAIQGHAELLLKRGRSNPEILTEALDIIRRESTRLGKLVEDLLLLAQLRHRRPQAEIFNLASVARQVVESRQLLHENLSYSGPHPATMAGDQGAVRRILINLIDNALRFTPPDAPIEVEVLRRDGFCWLIVRDHGAGIPAANLPHIFERFYRIEADRNRRSGGAGLGLPIVKELVEWHMGKLEVESSEDKGTVFTIGFPEAKKDLPS